MAFGADQNLYLIDAGNLCRIAADGKVTILARSVSDASLNPLKWDSRHALMGLAADKQGNVYVACHTCSRVKKVGRDGRVTVFDRSSGKWAPTGVAVTAERVYILEYGGISDVRIRSVALTSPPR